MTAKMFEGPNGQEVSMSEAIRRVYHTLVLSYGNDPSNDQVFDKVKKDYGFEPSRDMLRTVLRRHRLGDRGARGKSLKTKEKTTKKPNVAPAVKEQPETIESLLNELKNVVETQEELEKHRYKLITKIDAKLRDSATELERLEALPQTQRAVTVDHQSSVKEIQ